MRATVLSKFTPSANAARLHRVQNATVAHADGVSLQGVSMPVTLICCVCSQPFNVIPSRANKAKYCAYPCHQIGEGRKGGKITGEQRRANSQRKSYPKLNGRHIHRQVAELKLGRKLKHGEIVHHKDEDRQNNSPENLEVLASQALHMQKHRRHMLAQRKAKHGY